MFGIYLEFQGSNNFKLKKNIFEKFFVNPPK